MPERQTPVVSGLGRLIKERREALGMSQNDLAARLQTRTGKRVAVSQISRWERLTPVGWIPKPYIFNELARVLEVDPAELIRAARPEAALEEGDSLEVLGRWQVALASMTDLQPEIAAFLENAISQARRLEASLRRREGAQD